MLQQLSPATIEPVDPATGEVIAAIPVTTADELEAVMARAQAGQALWAAMTGTERGRILRRAADILRERNEELALLETRNTGKPVQETLAVDVLSGADCLEYFAGVAPTIAGQHLDLGPGAFGYTRREPLGIVAGIGAWNYPLQIACWKAAPALACGNAMVFKPAEQTPLTAIKLAEVFADAGLPDGVFQVVQGYGETGRALVAHPAVAKVSLTGSVPTGRRVAAAAGEGLKAVTLELGGKSPLIVFADASIENAVVGRDARQLLLDRAGLLERHPRVRRAFDPARVHGRAGRAHPPAQGRRPDRSGNPDRAAGERRAALTSSCATSPVPPSRASGSCSAASG